WRRDPDRRDPLHRPARDRAGAGASHRPGRRARRRGAVSSRRAPDGLRHMPGRAVLYMTAAVAFQTVLDASVKWLTDGYTVPQIAFIRYLMSLAVAVLIAGRMGGLATLKTRRPLGH